MSAHSQPASFKPVDLSRWQNVPNWLLTGGAVLTVIGAMVDLKQFAHSWLQAFMFFLSLCLGSLFLVIVHHLFDAGWSVPLRRFLEHLANLIGIMVVFFIPIALLAPKLYHWMTITDPTQDHALHAKWPLFTVPMFYVVAAFCFAAWIFLARRLRFWSLQQDKSGAALCTFRMRRLAAAGIFFFAVTLTLAAIMWMKAMAHEWFSTMYGVYYFAGSVWMTLAAAYFITMTLVRAGRLKEVLHEHQFYFLGTLMFAFTVFYAYIAFSQYFIIWNANLPEETFWYVVRERGTWWYVGMVLIFGHFFLPFLSLLRIDAKHYFPVMTFLCFWAWIMHFVDMSWNVMPTLHPDGFPFKWLWLDLGCLALIAGVLSKFFLRDLNAHPLYPLRDPRLIEAMGHYHPVASPISGGEMDEMDNEEKVTGPVSPLDAAHPADGRA